jgi:hypothetical protein
MTLVARTLPSHWRDRPAFEREQRMESKRIALGIGAALVALAGLAPAAAASPRSGDLHMTKECSEYTFLAGSFCTFTSSNIRAVEAGDRIVYADAASAAALDTDVVIEAGPGNVAAGHCTLVFASLPGRCTFTGGTGIFRHFQATVAVSVDTAGLWHWDGTYSFSPKG